MAREGGAALEERATQWARSHDSRFLLSLKEYLAVQLRARASGRQSSRRRCGWQGGGHGRRWAGVVAGALRGGIRAATVPRICPAHETGSGNVSARRSGAPRLARRRALRRRQELRPLSDLAIPMLRGLALPRRHSTSGAAARGGCPGRVWRGERGLPARQHRHGACERGPERAGRATPATGAGGGEGSRAAARRDGPAAAVAPGGDAPSSG